MEAKLSGSPEKRILTLSGKIHEKTEFPSIDRESLSELTIDCDQIVMINSLGIQRWLEFLNTLPAQAEITFTYCPPCIVFQINMIQGFLPKNGNVDSVLVPFYCNTCDREFTEKYNVGTDVTFVDDLVRLIKNRSTLCQGASCDIETDMIQENFFKFLTRTSE